jgi:hypothetical protein
MATHYAAKQAHPDIGNPETLRFTDGHARLVPAWSFVPSVGSSSDAPRVIGASLAAGARILRYYPNEYFTSLSADAVGDYLELMQDRRIPLFVDFSRGASYGEFQTDWDGLIAVCKAFRRLPVITSEYRIRSNRMLFRALDVCANLCVCTSGVWLYRNIEFIVSEFGAQRLLFGTNMPAFDPAIPVAMLRYAEIPDAARRAVASENLETLLSLAGGRHG